MTLATVVISAVLGRRSFLIAAKIFRNLVISHMTCDALGGTLPITSVQTNIRTGSNECTNNRKTTTLDSNGERRVKRIVIAVNIRVSFSTEQCLHSLHMSASHCIHECSASLRRLNLQGSLVLDESLNSPAVSLHRCIHQGSDTMRIPRINVTWHGKDATNLLGVAIIGCAHQIGLTGVWIVWIFWHDARSRPNILLSHTVRSNSVGTFDSIFSFPVCPELLCRKQG